MRRSSRTKAFACSPTSEKLPIAFQGTGIITRRSTIASSAGTVENVIRALLDGVAFIRIPENKPQVVKSLAKGLRLKRIDDAEEGYQSMLGLYERKIYPSVDGVERYPSPRRRQRKDPPPQGRGIGG